MGIGGGADEHCARTVAEEGVGLHVFWIGDSAVGISTDDEAAFGGACFDEVGSNGQRVDEAGTGGLEIEGATPQFETVLKETRGGGKCHIGRKGGDDDEVNFILVDAAGVDAAPGGFVTEVAGGHFRGDLSAFLDAGAGDDPGVVEPESLFEVGIGDDEIGDVAAGAENAKAGEGVGWGEISPFSWCPSERQVGAGVVGDGCHGSFLRPLWRSRSVGWRTALGVFGAFSEKGEIGTLR